VKLDANTINELVELLRPFMEDEGNRRPFLVLALGNSASVLQRITWSGSVATFIAEMVCKLADYGEVAPGKPALWTLLECVRSQVGVDVQRRIDKLRFLIDLPTSTPTDTASIDVPVQNKSYRKEEYDKLLDREVGETFLKETLPQIIANIPSQLRGNISIGMADIDELTIINKRYGIEVGNEVLAAVATIIREECSSECKTGRCGDDTFYIFLPGFTLFEAVDICNKIRSRIENNRWLSLAPELRVTCSFGVAQWRSAETIKKTIVRAALGFNEAKKSSKNRVEQGPKYLPIKEKDDDDSWFDLRDYFS
jgi:diguanylate cyclase (GGDEF)-like protein